MNAAVVVLAVLALAQEVEIVRGGDGTVVVPGGDGDVVITTRTVGASRIPRRGLKLDEKQVERFLRDRGARESGWT